MTPKENQVIHAIADRAIVLYEAMGVVDHRGLAFARTAIVDEIRTVHREIFSLRLWDLLTADDLNFVHDIAGIHKHLDHGKPRQRAQLRDCFVPRFAETKR